MFQPKSIQRGFTLVEIVIVMLITAILASTAMWNAAGQVRKTNEGLTRSQLMLLRTSIEMYAVDHPDGLFPSADDIENELAPYLNGQFPAPRVGPVMESPSVKAAPGTDPFPYVDDKEHGWVYCEESGEIVINCSLDDQYGERFSTW